MNDYDNEYYYDAEIETHQVEDENGVVHYYEDGVEVETFYPDLG